MNGVDDMNDLSNDLGDDPANGLMEAVLERTLSLGYEIRLNIPFAPHFIGHAPMAAEALVTLGIERDGVLRFVEAYKRRYHHFPEPPPALPIVLDDWRTALGQYSRVHDWAIFFGRQLEKQSWRDVLALWGPRLMPGVFGGLTHGLIRTMHITRRLSLAASPSPLYLEELSKALALWAAKYTELPGTDQVSVSAGDVPHDLSRLVAVNAKHFLNTGKMQAVPMVHSMTAPAAFRFMLTYFPAETHATGYQFVDRAASQIVDRFGRKQRDEKKEKRYLESLPENVGLIAQAVRNGDEHVIKLTEAALRESALGTEKVVLAAAHRAAEMISA
jgi:hypothetical protein